MLITEFYIRKILTSLILKALNCWPIPLSQRLFEVRADWANWVLYMHDVEYIGIFHTGLSRYASSCSKFNSPIFSLKFVWKNQAMKIRFRKFKS